MVQPKNNGLENLRFLWNDYVIVCYTYFIFEWMCNTAREIEAATQPLCQSGCRSCSATQPLWPSGWRSHSAEWLVQPLWQRGWVVEWLRQGGWSSHHSVTQSGWVAEWLRQPLWQSGWVAEWLGWKFPPLRAQSNIFAYWWLTGIM